MSYGTIASAGDPLMRGLVAWYRMLGNANDSSGRGNTGTLVNSPTAAADKYGNSSSAYSFAAASTQYGTLAQNSGLPLYSDGGSFSIALWVKASNPSASALFGESNTGSSLPILFLNANGANCGFYIRDTSSVLHLNMSAANVFDGTWRHIAVTVTSGLSAVLFKDGASASTATDAGFAMGLSPNRSAFGALVRSTVGSYFTGSMSDLRLYNRALTANEVGTLYRAAQRI